MNRASKEPTPSRRREADGANLRRWLPAGAAVAVVAIVVGIGLAGRDSKSDAASDNSTPASGLAADPNASSTAVAPTVTEAPTTTIVKTHLTNTVQNGSSGSEVTEVQQRLKDLGFDPGPIDGQFGGTTKQAVWAFEKLILQTPRTEATGKVTDDMWQRMQDNLVISPLRPGGAGTTHVEVYVPMQVMIVFTDDKPVLVAHIATGEQNPDGTPKHWCETATYDTDAQGNPLPEPVRKQECADAKTPGGVFKINRFASGNHVSPLGGMFNPVYFNYGVAIHGAMNVPLSPASHGCVRISMTLAKTFPELVDKGDLVYVWAQDGKQPEQYSKNESLPSFNQPDPNASTTTSTTTIAPTTTVAATTTTKPAATTTVAKTTTTTAPKPTTTKPAPTTVAPVTAAPTTEAPATTVPAATP